MANNKLSEKEKQDLKLIYVHKVGETATKENIYDFIFSKSPESIDADSWGWNQSPACNNASAPDDYDHLVEIRLKGITLICLHDAVDREYLHGYYNIHALAYEDIFSDNNSEDDEYESNETDDELLVFHYGVTYQTIYEKFFLRNIKFE